MNVQNYFSMNSLKKKIFVCFMAGASITSVLSAQEKLQTAEQPQWALPVQSKAATRTKIQDTPALGLFESPQQHEAPTPKALPIQSEGTVSQNQNVSTTASTTVVTSLPAPSASKNAPNVSHSLSEPRLKLSDPLPISNLESQKTTELQAPTQPLIRDNKITQAGNTEPQLLTPDTSGSNPFPNDDPQRMSPPKASLFASDPEPTATQTETPNSFPADNLAIPAIDTPQPVAAPALSEPAPFGNSLETQKVEQPAMNNIPPVQQPVQTQTTYDPPIEPSTSMSTSQQSSTPVNETVHEVQPGENYWTISRQHFGTARFFAALAEYNKHRIPRPDRMKPGMFVLVPDAEVLEKRYPKMAGIIDAQPSPESLLKPGFFIGPNNQPFYRIGKGDTLTEIAETHLGRTARWSQIVGMNRDLLRDGNNLKIGMVLRLPHDASQVSLAPTVQ